MQCVVSMTTISPYNVEALDRRWYHVFTMPLKRSYSAPAGSGGGTLKRRASNAARQTRARLNKPALKRSKTSALAKKAAAVVFNERCEHKYFYTRVVNTLSNLPMMMPDPTNAFRTSLSVLGFCSGTNANWASNGAPTKLAYGVDNSHVPEDIIGLCHGSCFHGTGATYGTAVVSSEMQPLTLEGQETRPMSAWTKFRIRRTTPFLYVAVPSSNSLSAANEAAIANVALSIKIRVIHVKAKMVKGSVQPINPEKDLFLNQFGMGCGISNNTGATSPPSALEGFNDMSNLSCPVNTAKYTVLNDFTKILGPNVATTQAYSLGSGDMPNPITQPNNTQVPECSFTLRHKIGSKLKYDPRDASSYHALSSDPATAQNWSIRPCAGIEQEFILIHSVFVSPQSQKVPHWTNTDDVYTGLNSGDYIKVSAWPSSTYTDA